MFEIEAKDRKTEARAGVLQTENYGVKTPAFMPVATKGSVKTLSNHELAGAGVEALISNALLLYLKPGIDVISGAGGLHGFMKWKRAIFTDNGGFQAIREEFSPVFSKRGITFSSPFDSSRHLITPEKIIGIQEVLGSDVALALDDCPSYGTGYNRAEDSVKRTTEWAKRSLEVKSREGQLLFCIAQGGVFPELRIRSAGELAELNFDGYAIGGLSIGEPKKVMMEMIEISIKAIPQEKPRYLMGVGSPVEVLDAIAMGVDIFDSAFPTRNARHNAVYTEKGKYNIAKAKNLMLFEPLEEGCSCYACRHYTRSYISHLMRVYEALGMRLVTLHNIHFTERLMRNAREAIVAGEFDEFREMFKNSFLS